MLSMSDDLYHSWCEHWDFRTPLYMNHGSFGLTPKAVLEYKSKIEAELNRDRDEHFWFTGMEPLEKARLAVAEFVNAPTDDLVLVDHVTEAVTTILKSLSFEKGDEIIITSHSYPPYEFMFAEFCRRTGVKLVIADIPFPVTGDENIVKIITDCVTDKTKLTIIDHITSPTALLLPIADIVKALEEKGVDTYVDGAHGIGHVPLDVQAIGAAYYASNHHKWLSAPLQSGFLYVRPDKQENIIPPVGIIYADTEHKFTDRFIWQGTKEQTARMCLPETIRYMDELHPDGWPGIYKRNHKLALAAREMFCEKLGFVKGCPDDMVPCMFSVPLGELDFGPNMAEVPEHARLNALMREKFGYGLNSAYWNDEYILRFTAHLYNSLSDYERVADDLAVVLPDLERRAA